MDAPYTGGTAPGGRLYAVDGDFSIAAPCGPPEISYPLQGDSQPSGFSIVILDRTLVPPDYVLVPVGQGFNVQDYNQSQATMVIEQEFMVAEAWYQPMPLNAGYNPAWSVGWNLGGNALVNIADCFLVEEGPFGGVGGGFVRFKRKFCNLPPNRNEYESYGAQFPALDFGGASIRFAYSRIVNSRVFSEYFVIDNFDYLPGIALFPAGHRLNTNVITNEGAYLLIEDTKWFKGEASAVNLNNLLDNDQPLSDDATGTPPAPTKPSYTTYNGWIRTAEIVVESSAFSRWMGNIYCRKTRFVLAE